MSSQNTPALPPSPVLEARIASVIDNIGREVAFLEEAVAELLRHRAKPCRRPEQRRK